MGPASTQPDAGEGGEGGWFLDGQVVPGAGDGCVVGAAEVPEGAEEVEALKKFPKVLPNGYIHATNSVSVADDVAGANMFVPQAGRRAPHPTSDLAGYDK